MNQPDNQYTTLSGAVEALKKQGYSDELTLTDDGLFRNTLSLDPALFVIDSFHRFEGPTDPADLSIVYAVRSEELGLKGLLVSGYGANVQDHIQKMVKSLAAHAHEGRVQPVQPVEHGESIKA